MSWRGLPPRVKELVALLGKGPKNNAADRVVAMCLQLPLDERSRRASWNTRRCTLVECVSRMFLNGRFPVIPRRHRQRPEFANTVEKLGYEVV